MTQSLLILLVEDEIPIRDLVELGLQDGGFAVVTANNGAEAIAMLEADSRKFHAVLSDVNLGSGPSGWAVAKRARELNEHLPIIYMTGGNGHEWASYSVPKSVVVRKPFSLAQMVTVVSQLLDASEQQSVSCTFVIHGLKEADES